jgi:2-dehydropantoate 2-reductase
MKIGVFGAGAIGGVYGGLLAHAGEDVTFVARGATLDALKRDGLKLVAGGTETAIRAKAVADPKAAGAQDAVILAVKAYSLPEAAGSLAPLLGRDTAVVMVQNGLPWWYFRGTGGALDGTRLKSVDADGKCAAALAAERCVGGAIYCPAEAIAPATIRHAPNPRIVMGEAVGLPGARLKALAVAFERAGVAAEVTADIRTELWRKLLNLVGTVPVSVLTGANAQPINRDEGTRKAMWRTTEEAIAVAAKVGVTLPAAALDRFLKPVEMPPNKVSTLQDLERGRPLEIDALLGVVAEIGRLVRVPTPALDTAYALCRMLAIERKLYPPNPNFALSYF